jgi:hypothetical protein
MMKNISTKHGVAPKRRALGDITNAMHEDEHKDNNTMKKMQTNVNNADTVFECQEEVLPGERIYMQRSCDDIDGRDSDNPLLVTCHVNEMYVHFMELEREFAVKCSYMSRQDYINEKMRTILVDWLVFV